LTVSPHLLVGHSYHCGLGDGWVLEQAGNPLDPIAEPAMV
jgi:hypothetical protein